MRFWRIMVPIAALALSGCGTGALEPASKDGPDQPSAPVRMDPIADAAEAEKELALPDQKGPKAVEVTIYLYFKVKTDAENARGALRLDGFAGKVRKVYATGEWTCAATKSLRPGASEIRDAFARAAEIARKHGGEYDGWSTAVD